MKNEYPRGEREICRAAHRGRLHWEPTVGLPYEMEKENGLENKRMEGWVY